MRQIFTPGWTMALMLFAASAGGAFYAHKSITRSQLRQSFQDCLADVAERPGLAMMRWTSELRASECRDSYALAMGGKYGPEPDMTLSLAMVRRPVFNRFN